MDTRAHPGEGGRYINDRRLYRDASVHPLQFARSTCAHSEFGRPSAQSVIAHSDQLTLYVYRTSFENASSDSGIHRYKAYIPETGMGHTRLPQPVDP